VLEPLVAGGLPDLIFRFLEPDAWNQKAAPSWGIALPDVTLRGSSQCLTLALVLGPICTSTASLYVCLTFLLGMYILDKIGFTSII
jgi:hypothetical protein